jgi:hypothetical protein
VHAADIAVYEAKAGGRNRVVDVADAGDSSHSAVASR